MSNINIKNMTKTKRSMGLHLYIKYMTWDHEKVINESELGIHIGTGTYLTGFYKFGSAYAKFRNPHTQVIQTKLNYL